VASALARLDVPFQPVTYATSGRENIHASDFSYSFAYEPAPEESSYQLKSFIRTVKGNPDADYADIRNWRKITEFSFAVEGKTTDLFSILPKDCEVLINPTSSEPLDSMSSTPPSIYLVGDIATPHKLMTLLHEIGHFFDDTNLEKRGTDTLMRTDYDGSFDPRNARDAEMLRKERNATAFAFKVINDILPNGQLKKDAFVYLKDYALQTYHSFIHESLSHRAAMDRFYRSDVDYYVASDKAQEEWDEYEEWRKTDAYKKWKALPENAAVSIEAGDEYGHWRQWVQKSGYDFYKDIYPDPEESI